MASDDELAHHAGDAQQQHARQIDDDESRTTILARHIRETPHIAQSDGRACRGKNDA